MKPYWNRTGEETLSALGSGNEGLTSEEAASRLEKNGKNKLAEGKKTPLWRKFLGQLGVLVAPLRKVIRL